jgi:putative acetyltransferase
MSATIRPERPGDEAAIADVTRQAFESHPYSHQTEHFIIDALRRAGALSVSLVAVRAGEVVGHIAFSPVVIENGSSGWYGLGPVSVLPALQRKGIGRALVEHGLAELGQLGATGCVLVGDPVFYARFGFANTAALMLDGVPQEFFLALPLGASSARGKVKFHAAFDARG